MSKTNSQSTQAEECGVSKISAEVPSNCSLAKLSPEVEALLDSLPLRTRVAIASEFDELAEKHLEVLSEWAAQQHKDAAEIDYLTSTINTKNSKIKYLEGRLEELVGNAVKTKTYHQSDVDKRVEELEDNN